MQHFGCRNCPTHCSKALRHHWQMREILRRFTHSAELMVHWSTVIWGRQSAADVVGMFPVWSSLSAAAVNGGQLCPSLAEACTESVCVETLSACNGWIVDGNVMLLGLARGRLAEPQSKDWSSRVSHGGPLSGRFSPPWECFEPSRMTTPHDDNVDVGMPLATGSELPAFIVRRSSAVGDSHSGLNWLKFNCEKAVTGEIIPGTVAGWESSKSSRAPLLTSILCFLTEVASERPDLSNCTGMLRSSFSNSSSWPRKLKFGEIVGLLSLTYLKHQRQFYTTKINNKQTWCSIKFICQNNQVNLPT